MRREKIREQFSLLEEQLEKLTLSGQFACEETSLLVKARSTFTDLQDLVRDETLHQKSIEASSFLTRIIKILVQEAAANKQDIAITQYGSGRVSLEVLEASMGTILACLRASLHSFTGVEKTTRAKNHLFTPFSFYVEVHATLDEIHFRLMDDGRGFDGHFREHSQKYFRRIRAHLAKVGGWFHSKSLEGYGGLIEFKIPLHRNRFESYLLKHGAFEVLIPSFFIGEAITTWEKRVQEQEVIDVAALDSEQGLVPAEEPGPQQLVAKVGVADFQIWVICDSFKQGVMTRRFKGEDLVDPNSWFKDLGVYSREGIGHTLPLIDGDVIMKFHLGSEGENEGI